MNIAFLPNLAGPDGILILLIILLLFGAKKLPELAKGMGQAVREFSKAKDEVHNEITRPVIQAPPQPIDGVGVVAAVPRESAVEVARETHPQETTHQI